MRATYERNATGGAAKVQVLADSKLQQDIVVRDGDNHGGPGRKIATTPLRADGGRYMARVDPENGVLPTTVDIINRGDTPQTVKNVTLTDAVTASAVYHTSASAGGDVLHVQASSSDGQLAPTELTVGGFNKALGSAGSVDIQTLAPPDPTRSTSRSRTRIRLWRSSPRSARRSSRTSRSRSMPPARPARRSSSGRRSAARRSRSTGTRAARS